MGSFFSVFADGIKFIGDYFIQLPIYIAVKMAVLFVIIAIPVFLAGMLVALFGTIGHILFLLIFVLGVYYYIKTASSIFTGKKDSKTKTKSEPKTKTKFINNSVLFYKKRDSSEFKF